MLTDDRELVDALTHHCAAANVLPEVLSRSEPPLPAWTRADSVLVGADRAVDVARLELPRRDAVVLVGRGLDPGPLWPQAVALRAEAVMVLPADQDRLAAHLAELADRTARAVVVGVVGAGGGAGASTVAAALALSAARAGRRSILVDADRDGGGLDLLLGCEDVGGVRWPDLARTDGRVGAADLWAALPRIEGLHLICWPPGGARDTEPATIGATLETAQHAADLLIVDLPRRLDHPAVQLLVPRSELMLVVITADVCSVAAGRRLVAGLREHGATPRAWVRQTRGSGVDPESVAEALGVPLAAAVRSRSSLARAVNDGRGPLHGRAFTRRCGSLIGALGHDQRERR